MASLKDARRIAMSLAGTIERADGCGWSAPAGRKSKQFAWVWNERVHPKKPRVPNVEVLAVRVDGLDEKEALLASDEKKIIFFTEPHYDGFPAVLVRLRAVTVRELRALITAAHRLSSGSS